MPRWSRHVYNPLVEFTVDFENTYIGRALHVTHKEVEIYPKPNLSR